MTQPQLSEPGLQRRAVRATGPGPGKGTSGGELEVAVGEVYQDPGSHTSHQICLYCVSPSASDVLPHAVSFLPNAQGESLSPHQAERHIHIRSGQISVSEWYLRGYRGSLQFLESLLQKQALRMKKVPQWAPSQQLHSPISPSYESLSSGLAGT